MQYKIGIIGLGVGEQHIVGYEQAGCRVKTICDMNKKKLNEVLQRHPHCQSTPNPNCVLSDPEIDIVSIASYDNFHAEQVIAALNHEKHVFVEKPLCQNRSEAVAIRSLLNKKPELFLSSNLILRKYPRFIDLKARIKRKDFGDIYYVEADYEYGRMEKLISGWRGKIPMYSVMQGGGIHMIDLLTWLLESPVEEVSAMGSNICSRGTSFRYNDLEVAIMKLVNGVVAKITCNFACVKPHFHQVRIFGRNATYINDFDAARIYSSRVRDKEPTIVNTPYPGCAKGDIIPNFVETIRTGQQPTVSKEDIFAAMSTCLSIEQAIHSKNNLKVEYL